MVPFMFELIDTNVVERHLSRVITLMCNSKTGNALILINVGKFWELVSNYLD